MRPSREPKEQQFASGHKYSQKKQQENQEEGEKLEVAIFAKSEC